MSSSVLSVSFFQRSEAFDEMHFQPLNNGSGPIPLNVALDSVTDGVNEFTNASPDVFEFSEDLCNNHPTVLHVLSLAAKLCTAMLKSAKFINNFESEIVVSHTSKDEIVQPMTPEEKLRLLKLIDGGFSVHTEEMDTNKYLGAYTRSNAATAPRKVLLNALWITRIEEALLYDFNALDVAAALRTKLRKFAAYLGVILFNEAGGHALHTFVRPAYFFDDAMALKQNPDGEEVESPARLWTVHGGKKALIRDFGSSVELGQFFKCTPATTDNVDIHNNPINYNIGSLALMFEGFDELVDINVLSSDFSPATYGADGPGLFAAQYETAVATVTSKARAISKRTAHQAGLAAGGRARPVAIPGPDEYDGDDEVKPHVHHVHKIATNLHEQFNLHVHSSTGSVLAGDFALRVGGRTRDVR